MRVFLGTIDIYIFIMFILINFLVQILLQQNIRQIVYFTSGLNVENLHNSLYCLK